MRAVDLLAPLAYGQRVLVSRRGRSGRTTLLRSLARAAAAADTAKVIVLLIDERPEERDRVARGAPGRRVRDRDRRAGARRAGADRRPALERARRLAETGTDAVCLDSLSRLAFAAGDGDEVSPVGSAAPGAGGGSLTGPRDRLGRERG